MDDKDVEKQDVEGEPGQPPVKRWPLYAVAGAIAAAIVAIIVVLSVTGSTEETGPTATPTTTYEVTVSIEAPASVGEGQVFTAQVSITGVENFDSAVYDVAYDPLVLEVTAISHGAVDATEVPVDMWDFVPSGLQGRARIVNNVPGVPGVSGSGYLSEIQFTVVGSSGSESGINFSGDLSMADNTAKDIDASWVGTSVSVQ